MKYKIVDFRSGIISTGTHSSIVFTLPCQPIFERTVRKRLNARTNALDDFICRM